MIGPPAEILVRPCICTGLFIKTGGRSMFGFNYVCVNCGAFGQDSQVEYLAPLRREIVR